MKVMSLNLWCGQEYEKLVPFLAAYANEVDVFCFQEVHDTSDMMLPKQLGSKLVDVPDLFSKLQKLLPNHIGFFSPRFACFGQAMFIRKSVSVEMFNTRVIKDGFGRILPEPGQPCIAQFVDVNGYRVINVHGWWTPGIGKGDTPDRIEQSTAIRGIVEESPYPVILCGDFNVTPDTESIAMLEHAGLTNWVVKNGVTSTRSELYTKNISRYADYIFTSNDIDVKYFDVLPVAVSDHLPLVIDIA